LVCRQARSAQKAKLLWKPSTEGYLKVNIDDAFDAISGHAGFGVVIRNSAGGVELSVWKAILYARDAEEVEAMACREGLSWGQRGAEERSSLNRIVQVWSSSSNNHCTRGRLHPIIGEAKKDGRDFPELAVKYTRRESRIVWPMSLRNLQMEGVEYER